jgi:CRP/FNR family transcriptional regulator, cyclic AMP receptor protein
MTPASSADAVSRSKEDPLEYLPCSPRLTFSKGQMIYDLNRPATSLFLILSGKVKASRCTGEGRPTVIDIYMPNEFFGESSLLRIARPSESAVAYEETQVMIWTATEIEDLSTTRPRLAIAMVQWLAQRSAEFTDRIESLALEDIGRRLARSLVHFAERIGSREDNGTIQMVALTHEFLAQYVGTSREIITQYMNRFRKKGYLQYSRRGISVHPDALAAWL